MPEHNMALIGIVRIVVLDFLRACISDKYTEKQKAEKHTNCHILCAPSIYHLPMFNVFHLSGTFLVTDKKYYIDLLSSKPHSNVSIHSWCGVLSCV